MKKLYITIPEFIIETCCDCGFVGDVVDFHGRRCQPCDLKRIVQRHFNKIKLWLSQSKRFPPIKAIQLRKPKDL